MVASYIEAAMRELVKVGEVTSRFQLYPELDICEVIGKGTFGILFRAACSMDGRTYAIKSISISKFEAVRERTGSRATVYDEFNILASLRNEFIVKSQDMRVNEKAVFIRMDFLGDSNLFDAVIESSGASKGVVNDVGVCISHALKYIHQNGIIHRDIKPENICRQSDRWLLVDFGLAVRISVYPSQTCVGTPTYMAPEMMQPRLRRHVYGYTEKVDCWSFGVTLYAAWCAKEPSDTWLPSKVQTNWDFEYDEEDWGCGEVDYLRHIIEGLTRFNEWERMRKHSLFF